MISSKCPYILPDLINQKLISNSDKPSANAPLVFLYTLYTNFAPVVPLNPKAISAKKASKQSPSQTDSAWKTSLLRELGGGEVINRTAAEGAHNVAVVNAIEKYHIGGSLHQSPLLQLK